MLQLDRDYFPLSTVALGKTIICITFGGAESRHTWEMYSIILFIFHISKTAVCILLELKIS